MSKNPVRPRLEYDRIFHLISFISLSGEFRTKQLLDREAVGSYRFIVVASDHGKLPKSGKTTVVVTVQDVNDNAPIFERVSHC